MQNQIRPHATCSTKFTRSKIVHKGPFLDHKNESWMNPHLMKFLWNSLQWSRYAILAMGRALKRPAAVTATAPPGRSRSCDDFDGLRDAMQPWVTKMNFITYTSEKNIKSKDVKKLEVYLPHLKRIQRVHRTWNFSLSLIDQVLQQLNQVRVVQILYKFKLFSIDLFKLNSS